MRRTETAARLRGRTAGLDHHRECYVCHELYGFDATWCEACNVCLVSTKAARAEREAA